MSGSEYAGSLEGYQSAFLESLGIYRRGYSPEGCVGRGSIVYASQGLQDRLLRAGFQGAMLNSYFKGDVSLTVRSMFLLASTAMASLEDKNPVVRMRNQLAEPLVKGGENPPEES